jgi:leader peptidase (prepilin peptidase)/N-methyltransferase
MTPFSTSAGILALVFAGVLGLAIGSFLNVVVWRLPRGESLSSPPSACPRCAHPIRARDNVPVLSWLLLRGRCRDCRAPISRRYPLVEGITALAFVVVGAWAVSGGFGTPGLAWNGAAGGAVAWIATVVAFLYLAAVSVSLALIDLDTHTLPNKIVLPAYPVALVLFAVAAVASGDWGPLLRAAIGGAALFLFYFGMALAYPRGMGFGDVKLAGVLGLYLAWVGWGPLLVGAFAAFLLGGLYSLALIAARKAGRKTGIPFGPWMVGGAWVGIFFGGWIAAGYLALVGLD